MTREYLGAADFAARADLATATIRSYVRKGLTPPADVIITTPSGPLRGWLPETSMRGLASRPGQGTRH